MVQNSTRTSVNHGSVCHLKPHLSVYSMQILRVFFLIGFFCNITYYTYIEVPCMNNIAGTYGIIQWG